MKISMRIVVALAALVLVASIALPAAALADKTDFRKTILQTMKTELDRSFRKLELEDFEKPYFISYLMKESNYFSASARFGAINDERTGAQRNLYVEVRVGSHEFDNTSTGADAYFIPGSDPQDMFKYIRAPIDDDPESLRNQLWLLTDAKYKDALSSYQSKKGKRVFLVEEEDQPPDFSREKAHRYIDAARAFQVDEQYWKDILRSETEYLLKMPGLLDSGMRVEIHQQRTYMVNTEGSEIFAEEIYFSLSAWADARARDGMYLNNHYSFYSRTGDSLPGLERIHAGVEKMAGQLLALKEAEPIEPYTGPAILDPSVAGVFFHEAIGHRLEGERQKNPEEGQTFSGKVGQQILPEFITVIDDPTLERFGRQYLNGTYRFDEEGIPAQRVVLVEDGILRNYLLSRSPVKGFGHSNGHGRSSSFEDPIGRMGNLIVQSSAVTDADALKRMLIDEARKQNKPYGLLLKHAAGGETSTRTYNFQAFLNQPLLIYKVDLETGEETLVRGAEVVGTPLVSINKILAAGDDPGVFNGYCGAESGYIPVSSIAPSLLVAEIELQKKADRPKRNPILPQP